MNWANNDEFQFMIFILVSYSCNHPTVEMTSFIPVVFLFTVRRHASAIFAVVCLCVSCHTPVLLSKRLNLGSRNNTICHSIFYILHCLSCLWSGWTKRFQIWYNGWSYLVPAYRWQTIPERGVVTSCDPFLARDVIHTSLAYATMAVSVCLWSALAHYS